MDHLRNETQVGLEVVQRALETRLARVGADEVTSKGHLDLATGTDVAVEDLVRREIEAALGDPVIGEERAGDRPSDGSPLLARRPDLRDAQLLAWDPLSTASTSPLIEDENVVAAIVGDPSTFGVQFRCSHTGARSASEVVDQSGQRVWDSLQVERGDE